MSDIPTKQAQTIMTATLSLDGEWLLAIDPENVGREQGWGSGPIPEAKPTPVPGIIQNIFPDYHGIAWYWRTFEAPANVHPQGRTLLRFSQVDYAGQVWLNGVSVGGHEGGEGVWALDVTEAIQPQNQLAVRVLNPTEEPIDGMTRANTPHRCKQPTFVAGAISNYGGILGPVEVLTTPPVTIDDLWARADPHTGMIRIQGNAHNAAGSTATGMLEIVIAPAMEGETLLVQTQEIILSGSDTSFGAELSLLNPRLWQLNDPYLYRVTARLMVADGGLRATDERSTRFGFRDFRCENGYLRLNGKRLFLRSTHTLNQVPIGAHVPHDPDLLRRDLLDLKVMGFNMVRYIWGIATPEQLDLCDEIGLMVYSEFNGSYPFEDGPEFARRFDDTLSEVIRRDRSHPSLTIWGLLNENTDTPQFRHAVGALGLVRALDDSRLVLLNSGRFDGVLSIGSMSNPGSDAWDHSLGVEAPDAAQAPFDGTSGFVPGSGDSHIYRRVPHTADTIALLRTLGAGTKNVVLTEYGIGTGVDLWRVTRFFEQLGATDAEDAKFYRSKLDQFLADYEAWKMDDVFSGPEDFFKHSIKRGAAQRTLGLNAIRANPHLIGYSLTGMMDHVSCGEGLITLFRELKPGTTDALFEGFAPLRLCLFAEPYNAYRGSTIRLEAVLANEDALPAGEYPLRLQVIGPDHHRIFQKTLTVTVPAGPEVPFAVPLFAEDVPIDGPAGPYTFVATFERGAAPTGGEATFWLDDRATLPPVETEVVLWGNDPILDDWLKQRGIVSRPFSDEIPPRREVILCGMNPPAGDKSAAFASLARRIGQGASAIFLSPELFAEGEDTTRWLPLAQKGTVRAMRGWLYQNDDWARRHPVFAGLPAGGLLDYNFYRDILPDNHFAGTEAPEEVIAATNKVSQDYGSGFYVVSYRLGAGRFVLNTLLIRENLENDHPVAERLLRNLLRDAARDMDAPLADLPPDFEMHLAS